MGSRISSAVAAGLLPIAALIQIEHSPDQPEAKSAMVETALELYTPVAGAPPVVAPDVRMITRELEVDDRQHKIVVASAQGPAPVEDCNGEIVGRYVSSAARMFELEESFLHSVIRAESACQAGAVSSKGAIGLMQLMPEHGAREAYLHLYGVDAVPTDAALADPKVNVLLGAAYLRKLFDDFAFVPAGEPRIRVVLAAYNWGPTRVLRRLPARRSAWYDGGSSDQWAEWTRKRTPAETRAYTARVLRLRSKHLANEVVQVAAPVVQIKSDFSTSNVYISTYR